MIFDFLIWLNLNLSPTDVFNFPYKWLVALINTFGLQNDQGGTYYRDAWMTFTRIRLLCAWPRKGDSDVTDLYYDEMG